MTAVQLIIAYIIFCTAAVTIVSKPLPYSTYFILHVQSCVCSTVWSPNCNTEPDRLAYYQIGYLNKPGWHKPEGAVKYLVKLRIKNHNSLLRNVHLFRMDWTSKF